MKRIFLRSKSFIRRFLQWRIKKDLDYLLAQANPNASLELRTLWVCDLIHWIRWNHRLPKNSEISVRQPTPADRLRFLFYLLDRNPKWKSNVGATLASILAETSSVNLFGTTGLSRETGLISELSDRLLGRFLPTPMDASDLSVVVGRAFPASSDARWIRELPDDLVQKLFDILPQETPAAHSLRTHTESDIHQALILLSVQALSLSQKKEIRERLPQNSLHSSPFFSLLKRLEELPERAHPSEQIGLAIKHASECRRAVEQVFFHLEAFGVSVQIVYALETINESLRRIERLLAFLKPVNAHSRTTLLLLGDLIEDQVQRQSILSLLDSSLRQLSRKIVERASETGEHYITRTKNEYFQMLKKGAGGGFLTAFTAAFKFVISAIHFAPFFEGFFLSMNYALSFLGIQSLGFTLATKQPAMTAPALAGKLLDTKKDDQDYVQFIDEVRRLTRSQFAAVLGNVLIVIPTAIAIDALYFLITHHHFLGPDKAAKTLASLNPLTSLTLLYSCFTGALLWMGSVAAGSAENWFVYHRIHEAFSTHPSLVAIFGQRRMDHWGKTLLNSIAPISGNFALGFLLGMTPVVGAFFGLPSEVRHVTLSAGSFALAAMATGLDFYREPDFWFALVSIPLIFLGNFGISFSLAMLVAVRARSLTGVRTWTIVRLVLKSIRKKPLSFLIP